MSTHIIANERPATIIHLYNLARCYRWVLRPNGRRVRSNQYSMRMATTDFSAMPK